MAPRSALTLALVLAATAVVLAASADTPLGTAATAPARGGGGGGGGDFTILGAAHVALTATKGKGAKKKHHHHHASPTSPAPTTPTVAPTAAPAAAVSATRSPVAAPLPAGSFIAITSKRTWTAGTTALTILSNGACSLVLSNTGALSIMDGTDFLWSSMPAGVKAVLSYDVDGSLTLQAAGNGPSLLQLTSALPKGARRLAMQDESMGCFTFSARSATGDVDWSPTSKGASVKSSDSVTRIASPFALVNGSCAALIAGGVLVTRDLARSRFTFQSPPLGQASAFKLDPASGQLLVVDDQQTPLWSPFLAGSSAAGGTRLRVLASPCMLQLETLASPSAVLFAGTNAALVGPDRTQPHLEVVPVFWGAAYADAGFQASVSALHAALGGSAYLGTLQQYVRGVPPSLHVLPAQTLAGQPPACAASSGGKSKKGKKGGGCKPSTEAVMTAVGKEVCSLFQGKMTKPFYFAAYVDVAAPPVDGNACYYTQITAVCPGTAGPSVSLSVFYNYATACGSGATSTGIALLNSPAALVSTMATPALLTLNGEHAGWMDPVTQLTLPQMCNALGSFKLADGATYKLPGVWDNRVNTCALS